VSAEWIIRASVPEDEDCLVSTWLQGYARSDEVRERYPEAGQGGHTDQIRFWKVYQPIVTALVRGADVRVVCPPDRATYEGGPAVIFAWACCSDDTTHWVCVKRSARAAGFADELVRMLIGERLEREQKTTFELVDLSKTLRVPKQWRRERGWLNAMRTLSARMLAGDKLTAQVGAHVLDTRREEWRARTDRAA
jgi:hypothetical protein